MTQDDLQKLLVAVLITLISTVATLLSQRAIKGQRVIKQDTDKNADKIDNSKFAEFAIQVISDQSELIAKIAAAKAPDVPQTDDITQMKENIITLQKELQTVREAMKSDAKSGV